MGVFKLSLALALVACFTTAAMATTGGKISPELAASLRRAGKVNILVSMKDGDTT